MLIFVPTVKALAALLTTFEVGGFKVGEATAMLINESKAV